LSLINPFLINAISDYFVTVSSGDEFTAKVFEYRLLWNLGPCNDNSRKICLQRGYSCISIYRGKVPIFLILTTFATKIVSYLFTQFKVITEGNDTTARTPFPCPHPDSMRKYYYNSCGLSRRDGIFYLRTEMGLSISYKLPEDKVTRNPKDKQRAIEKMTSLEPLIGTGTP
jgi:hypothetical protein